MQNSNMGLSQFAQTLMTIGDGIRVYGDQRVVDLGQGKWKLIPLKPGIQGSLIVTTKKAEYAICPEDGHAATRPFCKNKYGMKGNCEHLEDCWKGRL